MIQLSHFIQTCKVDINININDDTKTQRGWYGGIKCFFIYFLVDG